MNHLVLYPQQPQSWACPITHHSVITPHLGLLIAPLGSFYQAIVLFYVLSNPLLPFPRWLTRNKFAVMVVKRTSQGWFDSLITSLPWLISAYWLRWGHQLGWAKGSISSPPILQERKQDRPEFIYCSTVVFFEDMFLGDLLKYLTSSDLGWCWCIYSESITLKELQENVDHWWGFNMLILILEWKRQKP